MASQPLPKDARIFVAGHRGMVGSAIVRRLRADGFDHLLLASRDEVDLRDQAAVNRWFAAQRPEFVFLVAGTVGGILPNTLLPADFLYDNLLIHATVVHAAYVQGVRKLLYLGSSCIYPRDCEQPMREEFLLGGPLEPTNEAYAIAKIAGIKLCSAYQRQYGCNFVSAMPTNLYGPHDDFDLDTAHVLPALIRKFHEAKLRGEREVVVWGSGTPRREFLHVDDLADCCLYLMREYEGTQHINVGTGEDVSIRELAELVRRFVHPAAELVFDSSRPDGMPRKLLDVSRLHQLGWKHRTGIEEGVASTCAWFAENYASAVAPRKSLLLRRGALLRSLAAGGREPR
jgi:GDP-L-fucose synthase